MRTNPQQVVLGWLSWILATAIFFPVAAAAQRTDTLRFTEPKFEGIEPRPYKVLGVRVQGLSTIEERDVLARFPIEVGKTVTLPGPELSDAIKRLWRQKLFSDIKL